MDIEKVEKIFNVKVVDVEEVKGRVFPLFDLVEINQMKLALIKDPIFVVVNGEDVYEMKIDGGRIIVETNNGYLILKYAGEPNIDVLRLHHLQQADKHVENADAGSMPEASEYEEEVEDGREEDDKEQVSGGNVDAVKEILEKLPKWADGAVVIREGSNVAVYPVKKSTKKDGAYYAATSWRPLDVRGTADLANCVITRSGKVIRTDVYINDKYINVFTKSRKTSPRRSYRR